MEKTDLEDGMVFACNYVFECVSEITLGLHRLLVQRQGLVCLRFV